MHFTFEERRRRRRHDKLLVVCLCCHGLQNLKSLGCQIRWILFCYRVMLWNSLRYKLTHREMVNKRSLFFSFGLLVELPQALSALGWTLCETSTWHQTQQEEQKKFSHDVSNKQWLRMAKLAMLFCSA